MTRDVPAEAAPATSMEDLQRNFPYLVIDTCISCGKEFKFVPVGVGSAAVWEQYFRELARTPRCGECATREEGE
jgi:hypothetical protein